MTERIKSLLDRTFDKEQKKFRRDVDWKPLLQKFIDEKIDDETRARMGLEVMLAAEEPAFMEGETIHFLRTVREIPDRISPVMGKPGVFRPGTGSAMYYIWHAREVPASADGRLKGHPLSANYAPSLDKEYQDQIIRRVELAGEEP